VPVVTHHSSSVIPLNPHKPRVEQHELTDTDLGCPYSLRAGDIYTHCFHAFKSTIIDGGSHIQSIVSRHDSAGIWVAFFQEC